MSDVQFSPSNENIKDSVNNLSSVVAPHISEFYSDNDAPIVYYFVIKHDASILEEFLTSLSNFSKKKNFKYFSEIKLYNDAKAYYKDLQLLANDNVTNDKKEGYRISWYDIPSGFARAQEIYDSGSIYVSLYINPKLNFELISNFLVEFSAQFSIEKKTQVECLFRLNGSDRNKKVMLARILEGLNHDYNRNYSKITDFTDEELNNYFVTYYTLDFENKIKFETDYSISTPALKEKQLENYSLDIHRTLNAHKEILGQQEVPCMTKIYNARFDSGLVMKSLSISIRPTPVIEILDVPGNDNVNNNNLLFNFVSGEFFKITKENARKVEIEEINKLDKEIADKSSTENTEHLQKMKAILLKQLTITADNNIKGKFSEKFFEMVFDNE